jgi:Skp family chaperone for outer membrane proteins
MSERELRYPVRGLMSALFALLLVTGCSSPPKSTIGLIDTQRITNNWPKFQNYQNQIAADEAAIQRSNATNAQKAQQVAQLQERFVSAQRELTDDVSSAAEHVAKDKGLTYVLTRQYVGYGGVDITSDIEKILKITEPASPKP